MRVSRDQSDERTGNFRVARNPSRIGGRRGDHFLQADFSGLIRTVEAGYLPVSRPLAQNASFLAFHTANLDSWLLAQNLVSVLRRTGSADSAEHSRSSCAERPGCLKAAKWSPFFSSLSPLRRAFGWRLLQRRTP